MLWLCHVFCQFQFIMILRQEHLPLVWNQNLRCYPELIYPLTQLDLFWKRQIQHNSTQPPISVKQPFPLRARCQKNNNTNLHLILGGLVISSKTTRGLRLRVHRTNPEAVWAFVSRHDGNENQSWCFKCMVNMITPVYSSYVKCMCFFLLRVVWGGEDGDG